SDVASCACFAPFMGGCGPLFALSFPALALSLFVYQSGTMAFLGFPFVILQSSVPDVATNLAIDRSRLSEIFLFSSDQEAEAIETVLGDSYKFQSRRARSNADIAVAFVSFCLLLEEDLIVVEFLCNSVIRVVHHVGLGEELADFSLSDPLLWIEEVDELAVGSGRGIQWICGQYRALLHHSQSVDTLFSLGRLDHRLLPAVDIEATGFPINFAIDQWNELRDRARDAYRLLLREANRRASTSFG
ncbi:hypothetical protein KI387_023024, partial [Taxus chinensis]